jgi:hypothetical protein
VLDSLQQQPHARLLDVGCGIGGALCLFLLSSCVEARLLFPPSQWHHVFVMWRVQWLQSITCKMLQSIRNWWVFAAAGRSAAAAGMFHLCAVLFKWHGCFTHAASAGIHERLLMVSAQRFG